MTAQATNTQDASGSPLERPVRPDPERVAFEAWLNPGHHAGNVSAWVEPGRYEKDTHSLAWLAWKAATAAATERCAAWVDCRRLEFCFQHANHDPHNGAVEFGRGPHAEAKAEYVGELEEIAEGLRALGPNTPAETRQTAQKDTP